MSAKKSTSRFKRAGDSPGFLLWQVTSDWQREMRNALEPLDLTHPQFVLLYSCKWLNEHAGHEGIMQVQLAQHTKMDVNVTSQVLRTLEKKGLLKRNPHPTDTRANVIVLTEVGEQLAGKAVLAVEEADHAYFSVIADKKAELLQILQQLSNRS